MSREKNLTQRSKSVAKIFDRKWGKSANADLRQTDLVSVIKVALNPKFWRRTSSLLQEKARCGNPELLSGKEKSAQHCCGRNRRILESDDQNASDRNQNLKFFFFWHWLVEQYHTMVVSVAFKTYYLQTHAVHSVNLCNNPHCWLEEVAPWRGDWGWVADCIKITGVIFWE